MTIGVPVFKGDVINHRRPLCSFTQRPTLPGHTVLQQGASRPFPPVQMKWRRVPCGSTELSSHAATTPLPPALVVLLPEFAARSAVSLSTLSWRAWASDEATDYGWSGTGRTWRRFGSSSGFYPGSSWTRALASSDSIQRGRTDGCASDLVMLGGFIEVKRTFHSMIISPRKTLLAIMVEPEPGR